MITNGGIVLDIALLIATLGTLGTIYFTYADYKAKKASKEHFKKIAIIAGITFAIELFLLLRGLL